MTALYLFLPQSFHSLRWSPRTVVDWDLLTLYMTLDAPQEIVSAHSPDSDDAFMFYGLATKKVRSSKISFRHVLEDIETLNRKAMEGQYDLTASNLTANLSASNLTAFAKHAADP